MSDPSWADLGLWGLKLLRSGALPAAGLVLWGPAAVWQPRGAVPGRLVGLRVQPWGDLGDFTHRVLVNLGSGSSKAGDGAQPLRGAGRSLPGSPAVKHWQS